MDKSIRRDIVLSIARELFITHWHRQEDDKLIKNAFESANLWVDAQEQYAIQEAKEQAQAEQQTPDQQA